MKKDLASRRRVWIFVLIVIGVGTALAFLLPQFLSPSRQEAQKDQTGEDRDALASSETARGNIYDRNLKELAVSLQLASVYARPLEVRDIENVALQLAPIFGWEASRLASLLKSERSFLWLGRHLDRETVKKIAEFQFKGIYFVNETQRFYPHREAVAHVLGFGKDDQGLDGLEFHYDHFLRGVPATGQEASLPPAHLVLTLDLRIQTFLEGELAKLMEKTESHEGMVVVMNPNDGAILSMVGLPSYDPNHFWDYEETAIRNRIVTDSLCPGGLLKVFQLAAAYDLDSASAPKVTEDVLLTETAGQHTQRTQSSSQSLATARPLWLEASPGFYVSAGAELWSSTSEVSDQALGSFLTRLGFDEKTGIDLPEDRSGRQTRGKETAGAESTKATCATTVMHLASALCVLANDGKRVFPHLLDSVWIPGRERQKPEEARSPLATISPAVGKRVREALCQAGEVSPGACFVEALSRQDAIQSALQGETLDRLPANTSEGSQRAPHQGLLMAMAPWDRPEVVVVMALSGFTNSDREPSPLNGFLRKVMPRVLVLAKETQAGSTSVPAATPGKDLYRMWSEIQDKESSDPTAQKDDGKGRMPDVTGRSLRKALQILQQYNVSIRVVGSGQVVAQKPAAGAYLAKVEECVLELRSGQVK